MIGRISKFSTTLDIYSIFSIRYHLVIRRFAFSLFLFVNRISPEEALTPAFYHGHSTDLTCHKSEFLFSLPVLTPFRTLPTSLFGSVLVLEHNLRLMTSQSTDTHLFAVIIFYLC